MATKLRFGIVGTGGIANAHATALAALAADAEIVSCCDVDATRADAGRVLEASAKHGTLLSSMSQRRWFPAAQRIRRAIDDGQLGDKIVMGESYCEMWRDEAYYRRGGWRGRWDTEGGGVLMNQSPHNIDFLLWYAGPAVEMFGYWANV